MKFRVKTGPFIIPGYGAQRHGIINKKYCGLCMLPYRNRWKMYGKIRIVRVFYLSVGII